MNWFTDWEVITVLVNVPLFEQLIDEKVIFLDAASKSLSG